MVRVQVCRFAAAVLLVVLFGCGSGRHPVQGRVTFEDGSPLAEGMVIGEMSEGDRKVNARGNIQSDGTFAWGTEKPGDGAKPGKYQVTVLTRELGETEKAQGMLPLIDGKFAKFETSNISIEVKEGRNELPIQVTRPKGKPR